MWLATWMRAGGFRGIPVWLFCHGGPFVSPKVMETWVLVAAPVALVVLLTLAWRKPSRWWTLLLTPAVIGWFYLASLAIYRSE